MTVGASPSKDESGADVRCGVAEFLGRHGFLTECHWTEGPHSEDVTLQDFALGRGADTLVVGGFGHSRVREIMLGGVTRELVGACRLPVLMAH